MKVLNTLFFVLAVSLISYSQDIMTLTNGTNMTVFVSEANSQTIKFKKATDGPMYTMMTSDVRTISYADGRFEKFSINKNGSKLNDDELLPPSKKYGGPRIGLTYLSAGTSRERIADAFNRTDITPWISQFGWQFETRIFTLEDGSCGLVEFVPLIGGLEQGLFLPSASGIIGFRGRGGVEFGIGPSASLSGLGLVLAVGASFKIDKITFPINIVFSPNITKSTIDYDYDPITGISTEVPTTEKSGFRLSLIVGFNSRKL